MATEIAPGIVVNPEVRFGRPVIKGTRVPVELVLASLASGMTPEDIVTEYEITPLDIRKCLTYATLAKM